jgi:hypothetical protein
LYPNLPSALRPVAHGPEVPTRIPQPTEILEDASTNSSDSGGDDAEFHCHTESQIPQLFTKSERCNKRFSITPGKSGTLRLQIERKEFVGSLNIYVLVKKLGAGVYELLFTGW